MPFINISVAGAILTSSQKQQLFDETTRLMSEILRKNPELTSVRIDEFAAENWAVGGTSMTVTGKVAVHMDIKVTEGTNTDTEKAEMIKQAMVMLKEVIGQPPEASYVIIHDLPATTWGYDGQTQAARAMQIKAA
ncbi:MAG: tautomerase family protein [Halopseudomonas aestusnigri]